MTHSTVDTGLHNMLGAPIGLPYIPSTSHINHIITTKSAPQPPSMDIPGQGLPRAVNYMADYGGCSWYRCMAPNLMLNLYNKAVIMESTTMILDERFYTGVKAVKLQRQATPIQKEFVKMLKSYSQKYGFKLIYEIDDIVFHEDIPMYNRNRDAFVDPSIRGSIVDILELCEEITVTCDFMADYFKSKTNNKNVTVIPNYLLKWWFDRYYNLGDMVKKFEKNKKKPVISIFASGTHVDVVNRVNQKDDFEAIVQAVIKTRKEYTWQFYGSYPLPLKPFIDSGEIIHSPWVDLPNFPEAMANSGTQLCFAALQKNNFNFAKSNIKLIEGGALGIPVICPNMCTYSDAILKYDTGDEFIDQVKYALKDQTRYADLVKKHRAIADKYWLESPENLQKHYEAYFTPYGSPDRKFLSEIPYNA